MLNVLTVFLVMYGLTGPLNEGGCLAREDGLLAYIPCRISDVETRRLGVKEAVTSMRQEFREASGEYYQHRRWLFRFPGGDFVHIDFNAYEKARCETNLPLAASAVELFVALGCLSEENV